MRRGEAGVSLVELLIALALTGLTVALAARLLIGSQALFVAAAREARDPVIEIAVRQLRNDIQESGSAVYPGVPGWSSLPLVLLDHARFDEIRYERTSDLRLVRSVREGKSWIHRDLMRGVVSWRWVDLGGILSLRVSIRRQGGWGDPLNSSPEDLAPQSLEDLQWLNFAMRGRGLGYRW